MSAPDADTLTLQQLMAQVAALAREVGRLKTGEVAVVGGGGSGAAALADESFLVLDLTSDLSNERRLVPGDGLTAVDGGAGGDYTPAVDVSDFAGTGLEDDSSENLRIAASAAGDGLTGGAGSPLAVGAGYAMAVTADALHLALDTILLHHSGIITGEYATLALAIAAVTANDTLFVSSGTWTDSVTIPASVTVRGLSRADTVLSGQITTSDGTRVEDLSIMRTANDTTALVGVLVPASGTAYLDNVKISVTQNGAGTGEGIYAFARGGKLELNDCDVYGSTQDIV